MNNMFNPKRFGLLVGSHFRKNLKAYGVGSLVFAGVTAGLFVFIISMRYAKEIDGGTQFMVYLITIYGGLFLFTGTAFRAYQQAREGMFRLLLPASSFEKFLLAWAVPLLGYTLCANVLYVIVRYGVLHYYRGQGYDVAPFWDYGRFAVQPEGEPFLGILVMVYLFIHGFALLGSILFRKLAVLKSALMLLALVVGYWMFNGMLFRALFGEGVTQAPLLPFMPVYVHVGDTSYQVASANWSSWLLALSIVTIGLLWLTTYCKLKEKEA